MELIVISNPAAVAHEGKLINNLFQSGLKYFHLRKPDTDIRTLIHLLNEIDSGFYDRIALHQFHEMAEEFGIKRLHFTESARKTSNLKSLQDQLAAGFTLSTSIHNISSLPKVEHFSYIFYGPVFNSISKAGYLSKVPKNFMLEKADCKTKVIALGGVQASNLMKIKEMGFDGIAVLGTLWNEPRHAVEQFSQLKQHLT